jgi:hypothetical protein
MEDVVFIYDGREFETKEAMFAYAESRPARVISEKRKTENELVDEQLHRQFPDHDRAILDHLRSLKGGTEMPENSTTRNTERAMELLKPREVLSTEVKDIPFIERIPIFFANFSEFLQEKNRRYGDSVNTKKHVFFKGDNGDSIMIRLDDKLNRIYNNDGPPRPNDFQDVIGYIALFCCQKAEEDVSWLDPRNFLD